MSVALDTLIRQSPRIASRTIDGQAVVVVLDARRLHVLNGVGTDVLELADGRSVGAIVDEVVARYDVSPETARGDVLRFVDELVALGALVVA